ncbi:hypothetical protein C8Q74DRAFT_983363 [Fomes fomentarius]|nr:hypothetical protein C8Q74DRAFT_983363 [Fomes fomentarius]
METTRTSCRSLQALLTPSLHFSFIPSLPITETADLRLPLNHTIIPDNLAISECSVCCTIYSTPGWCGPSLIRVPRLLSTLDGSIMDLLLIICQFDPLCEHGSEGRDGSRPSTTSSVASLSSLNSIMSSANTPTTIGDPSIPTRMGPIITAFSSSPTPSFSLHLESIPSKPLLLSPSPISTLTTAVIVSSVRNPPDPTEYVPITRSTTCTITKGSFPSSAIPSTSPTLPIGEAVVLGAAATVGLGILTVAI